jgi:hypothetical protein
LPGNYSLVLGVGGKSFTQPLTVKMDPRVKSSTADLVKQFDLSKALYDLRAALQPIGKSFASLAAELTKTKEKAGEKPVKQKVEEFIKKLQEFANPDQVRAGQALELDVLNKVEKLFGDLQEVDAAPTSQAQAAAVDLQGKERSVMERWPIISQEVAALNSELESAGIEKIKFP